VNIYLLYFITLYF